MICGRAVELEGASQFIAGCGIFLRWNSSRLVERRNGRWGGPFRPVHADGLVAARQAPSARNRIRCAHSSSRASFWLDWFKKSSSNLSLPLKGSILRLERQGRAGVLKWIDDPFHFVKLTIKSRLSTSRS